jgi:hypothetical protein
MRMLSSQGELVRGRCKATNLCDYCATLAAVENAELLALDALEGDAPQLYAVLTTRTPSIEPADFYGARRKLLLALKRRWPEAEVAALVEFTTGTGPRSGGLRRPHWNLLIKGVPVAELDAARELIVTRWCAQVDAEPAGQYVAPIGEMGGLMRYLALHFQKQSQAPPAGWHGHRFLKSRGYLSRPTPEARAAARESLALKRELWRALNAGHSAVAAEAIAAEARELARATTWTLTHVLPTAAGEGEAPHRRMRRHLADTAPSTARRKRATETARRRSLGRGVVDDRPHLLVREQRLSGDGAQRVAIGVGLADRPVEREARGVVGLGAGEHVAQRLGPAGGGALHVKKFDSLAENVKSVDSATVGPHHAATSACTAPELPPAVVTAAPAAHLPHGPPSLPDPAPPADHDP